MDNDWTVFLFAVSSLAAMVVACAALLDGKQGIKDTFAGMGWMWFYVIGWAAVLICARYLAD
ncbi:hypothetical protein [Mesorhizobium amorphae]|uniref:Uncharacterized protein n=1 Tax=Mesorhizobium amorphae CCNWGS0123 TaxID=1082933 RepID=G6YLH2_9HYPH|nr:hypothetical protein [Mesorhizobium amorphae]ANT52952.1 hypothetical protein A6B35_25290 [Mesorhizobium amorphae CCNWGS0123]EHH02749.1 hypothetical protein MEA186_34289 [Mesorhizobium amorphae CCNWGS0123]GLR40815.1 hypothetical protein GCM10007880_13310 [Mesorhizobium amorphae]